MFASRYVQIFHDNPFTNETLIDLTKTGLLDLGTTVQGDIKIILRLGQPRPVATNTTPPPTQPSEHMPSAIFMKAPATKSPQIQTEMTHPQSTDTVQTSLFDLNETQLLETLEQIVTKKSNPTVHRLHFSSLHQSETEPIQEFIVCSKSIAPDCKCTCLNCQHDIQEQHVKDQLIRGLFNETLQTDILVKTSHLQSLANIIRFAEAFEVA